MRLHVEQIGIVQDELAPAFAGIVSINMISSCEITACE
jgi:hypothetical protein